MRPLDRIGKPIIVRPKKAVPATPCAMEVTTLFNCWRAIGVDAAACMESSRSLVECMMKRVYEPNF
jgi:hypothetical protein